MKKIQIKKIIKKNCRQLKYAQTRVIVNFDLEAVHNFRVSFKKMRAFLRFIKKRGNHLMKNKSMYRLQKKYKILGVIRDLQLQYKLMKNEKKIMIPSRYLLFLKNRINRLKKAFNNFYVLNDKISYFKYVKSLLPNSITHDKIDAYLNINYKKISDSINSSTNNSVDIHKIRKILKDLFYNKEHNKYLKKEFYKKLHFNNQDNKLIVEKLIIDMGSYQDMQVQLLLLQPNRIKKFNINERKNLLEFRSMLLSKKNILKNNIVSKLKLLIV